MKLIDVAGEVRRETDKAYLVYDGRSSKDKDGKTTDIVNWLPKSQVEYDERSKIFTMPEWLALEKGMI